MKFFSPKYPQFILGIFLSLTFFFAMPVNDVKAVEGADCRHDKPPIPAGQKLAKILRSPNGHVGQDNNGTPSDTTPCYVPILSGANTVSYQNLLDANVIPAINGGSYDYQFLRCTESGSPEPGWITEGAGPINNIQITDVKDCIVNAVGRGQELWGGRTFSEFAGDINNHNKPNYVRYKPTWALSNGTFLFFDGFEEGDKTSTETLQACKDAMAQAKDNNQNPCYKPDPAVDSDPTKFFELTKQMPLECKIVFEKCNLGDTPDPNKTDPRYGKPDGYEGPLPDCAFSYDGCRSINDVLQFLVNIGQQIFKYIGTFAFVMFIYGGFTMILSMGSAEKVKKGQEILTAAVVGIIISFGAYLLIDFILDALQVGKDFRSIGALEKGDEIPKK